MKIDNTIYLDHQATTPLDAQVFNAMRPYFESNFGNPHSVEHSIGWLANRAVEQARERVANLIGCDSDEIIFTSGATEANNLALLGICGSFDFGHRKRVLISQIEHKCVLEIGRFMQQKHGLIVEYIPVDEYGIIDLGEFEDMMSDDVVLVSVMAVNNEIGTIQNMALVSEYVRKYGAILHCDAAQAPCAIDLSEFSEITDMMSLSGHKMYGPMGIGSLYVRRDFQSKIKPLIHGGGQQNGLRSGTLATPLIVGMGSAAERIVNGNSEIERKYIRQFARLFLRHLNELPCQIRVNGPENPIRRHPGNLNVEFEGIDAADLLNRVQPRLAASTGSACTSGIDEPSHVLRSIKLTQTQANSSIRFSLGKDTTQNDIIEATAILKQAIENQLEDSNLANM